MRQTWKDRRKQLHQGMPTPRLLTMVLMLAVTGLLIARFRDPDTWHRFARDTDDVQSVVGATATSDAAAKSESPQTPAELTPTGSTDLDRIESEDMKSNISMVKDRDGTLEIGKFEMPAYNQILSWVDHQPIELLQQRARATSVGASSAERPT